jgi:hypothetical protein
MSREMVSEAFINFNTVEKYIFQTFCGAGRQVAAEVLACLDKRLMAERDVGRYRLVGRRESTIKTVMGEVAYKRRYYKDHETGKYVHLLDEALGMNSGYGLFSENIAMAIIDECQDKSFRKAAASVSAMTGQTVTAMGAWQTLQRHGEKAREREDRLVTLAESGAFDDTEDRIASAVLFEEMDGGALPTQKERRRKAGSRPAQGSGKRAWRELKMGTAYTGWRRERDGRYGTVSKLAYASFEAPEEFQRKREALLHWRFDMDGVERRILNGDGADWIKSVDGDTIQQLDPFHRSQAIIRGIRDVADRRALFDVVREKNTECILLTVEALYGGAKDEGERKRLGELLSYFRRNKDALLTWDERGIELPPPPEGIVYRRLGTQEHSNCDLIAQRMKHRKASWSGVGALNMAKALCYRGTIGMATLLAPLNESITAAPVGKELLSAAKAPKQDGKGDISGVAHGTWPFESAFKTAGRAAIRGLLGQRSWSDLSFR